MATHTKILYALSTSAAGSAYSSAVPAGKIWIVRMAALTNNGSSTHENSIGIHHGGVDYTIADQVSLAPGQTLFFPTAGTGYGFGVAEAGDTLFGYSAQPQLFRLLMCGLEIPA